MTRLLKTILFGATILVANFSANAQSFFWQQTNGPFGGRILSFAIDSTHAILAGTAFGGIFRSTNDGSSWARIGVNLPNSYVNTIAVNPQGHIFVGMDFEGAFRSTDNGVHWEQINNGLPIVDVQRLAVNSLGYLYAGTTTISRSTDNGNTWTDASSGLPSSGAWVSSLVITLSNHIFVAGFDSGRVFRSTDNGISWAASNVGLPSVPGVSTLAYNPNGGLLAGTQHGVFRSTNDGVDWSQSGLSNQWIRVMSINSTGVCFAGIRDVGVARSTDGGGTWLQPDSNLSNFNVWSLLTRGENTVLVGNYYGGVSKSSNNGETWTAANHGLINTWITDVAISRGGKLFAATAVEGQFRSTDDGQNWEQMGTENIGEGIVCLVARSDSELYAGTWEGGVFRSTDEGESWNQKNSGLTSLLVKSIAFDSAGTMFAAAGEWDRGGFFRSTDLGEHWVAANAGLTNFELTSMVVSPSNVIFLGSHGGIFRSTNSGETWVARNSGLFSTQIDDLEMTPQGHIFAGAGYGGLYRSTNGGNSWNFRGLGGSYIKSIKYAGTLLFVATWNDGIFQSTNEGQTWTSINGGLTDDYVESLAISGNNYMLAGSGYNGVFRSVSQVTDVTEWTNSAPEFMGLDQNYPNPFNASTNIKYQITKSAFVSLKVYDLLGRHVQTLVNESLVPGNYQVRFDAPDIPSGVYFYQLKADGFLQTKNLLLLK